MTQQTRSERTLEDAEVGAPDERRDAVTGDRAVGVWLLACGACVIAMVVVGGITRLTRSGLSITEWNLVTGVLPPIGDSAWADAFSRYQATPEYRAVNSGMDLAAFKSIFLVEWAHRLLGRISGLVFGVPMLWFLVRRRVRGVRLARLIGVFALGGLQGAVGWWMVKSGLVDIPRVSPYRLATHLLFAVAILGALVWLALDELDTRRAAIASTSARRVARALLVAIVVTLTWGALMAGLHAGLVAPTFPTMNGAWVPPGMGGAERDVFENPITVHFIHRMLAYLTAALAIATAVLAWRASLDPILRRRAGFLALLVAAQITLGALTVLRHVPIGLASAHQVNAVIVFACAVALLHRLRPTT